MSLVNDAECGSNPPKAVKRLRIANLVGLGVFKWWASALFGMVISLLTLSHPSTKMEQLYYQETGLAEK